MVHSVCAIPLGTIMGRVSDMTEGTHGWRRTSAHCDRATDSSWARQSEGCLSGSTASPKIRSTMSTTNSSLLGTCR